MTTPDTSLGDASSAFSFVSRGTGTVVLEGAGTRWTTDTLTLGKRGSVRDAGSRLKVNGALTVGTLVLDFDSFGGTLDAAHIVVDGYDRDRLDLSRRSIDGTLSVTAVPEPGLLALWLAGVGVVVLRARRSDFKPRAPASCV